MEVICSVRYVNCDDKQFEILLERISSKIINGSKTVAIMTVIEAQTIIKEITDGAIINSMKLNLKN